MHTYICYRSRRVLIKEFSKQISASNLIYSLCHNREKNKNAQDQDAQIKKEKSKTSQNKCIHMNQTGDSFNASSTARLCPTNTKCAALSTQSVWHRERKKRTWNNRGSATLETVCVLPVLLFAFIAFYMIGQIIIMENQVYQAARNTAEALAEYAYIAPCPEILSQEDQMSGLGEIFGIGMANARLQKELKGNYRVEQYVGGGRQGIILISDQLLDDEGFISFTLLYRIQAKVPMLKVLSVYVRLPIRQKAYVGYIPKDETIDENDIYVYITDRGTVYHMTKSCSHLKVTIHPMSEYVLRRDYPKIPPCEYCGKQKSDTYYVSEYGDCYHTSSTCSGLKRTIHRVKLSEVHGMRACATCGNK